MNRVEEKIEELLSEIGYDEATLLYKKLAGGKRLRAKLILKIASEHKDAPLLGAIIELIHAASLLHDDVIDEATLRRGVPSINATNGSKTAVMLGDIFYSKAFSALLNFDVKIAKIVADAVTSLSIGEMQDVILSENFNDNEAKYLDMLYLKTSVLIEAASTTAALLVGKDEVAFKTYGKNLGLSFQIIDDILDIVSDEATLGKPALHDFVEGKCTLPYIYLYHDLDSSSQAILKSFHKKELNSDESEWILEQFKKYSSVERSLKLAQKLSLEAQNALPNEPELVAILKTMMERTF
jgi:octaprenyl-diphosphate synthase